MFHLNYPRFRGFFAWDELGCLSRALGGDCKEDLKDAYRVSKNKYVLNFQPSSFELRQFPVDLFKNNLTEEINAEDKGLSLQETVKVLDYKLLYKALHMTQNLHTADWNSCVFRRCVAFLDFKALKFEEINNARVAYQAYEAGDMKGMLLSKHVLMRTLKMCNKTISPMKLLHRIKHSRNAYDEPGRIQLYEFLDLLLWADGYKGFVADETYRHFEMEDCLFKLSDFDRLLSHHDKRVANQLDAQYLKEEWEFPQVRYKDTKFKDSTVICGDSRVEMTKHQKQSYRHLRSEVGGSQKKVHCAKGGFVRERPVTAPNLGMYSQRDVEEYKRKQSILAQNALYQRLQELLRHAYDKNKGKCIEPVDMSDRPVLAEYKRSHIPKVVSDSELQETLEQGERLLFDIETEEGRYEIAMDTEMEALIPKYKQRQEELDKAKTASAPQVRKKKSLSPKRKAGRYQDALNALAYPYPRLAPSHSRRCDARFRGWYGVRSKKGQHYILMSPYFHNSPKGQLFQKLAKMSDAEIKNIHGNFINRKTQASNIDQRPVTAPAVMTMEEYRAKMEQNAASQKGCNSKNSWVSSGFGSMEENLDEPPTSKHTVDFKTLAESDNTNEREMDSEKEDENISSVNGSIADVEYKVKNITVSKDSVETSLSDKIKLMAMEKQEAKSDRPRAISAYNPREQLRNAANLNGQEGPYQRSKSAAGDNRSPAIEEVAPMPYMDHSKPKVISVGSIGKISLLESISEAKFWEDFALEQQKETSRQNTEIIEEPENEDSGAESMWELAADNIYIEEKISSQPKIKKEKSKGMADESFEESDIFSLILAEEKTRRNKQKSYHNRSKFDFASFKSWSAGSGSSRSSRIGSSNSRSSASSGTSSVEPAENRKFQCSSLGPHSSSSVQNDNKVSQKSEEKVNNVQKKVEVKDRSDTGRENVKPAGNKYERLVKRLGDDISPYMRKQMMKAAGIQLKQ